MSATANVGLAVKTRWWSRLFCRIRIVFVRPELFSARDSGQPAVEFRSAKAPKLANLNSDYCSSASHSLEGFRVDLQESSCLIGVEQRLELLLHLTHHLILRFVPNNACLQKRPGDLSPLECCG